MLPLNYHHLYYLWITAKAGRVSAACELDAPLERSVPASNRLYAYRRTRAALRWDRVPAPGGRDTRRKIIRDQAPIARWGHSTRASIALRRSATMTAPQTVACPARASTDAVHTPPTIT